ncbi:TauD/TfdA family dioxygenase [Frankia sp. CNm7]|uniref:TauD/TfdA family dioxygenase n=1 Tax=Frankia nepalensis TaxID=1836974 RepID=A0A937RK62_9ACTN|nr:TauD/TfdA family dioxygenase [Frankia nepalensis]MBL7501137.1 TauD/TfdA family dioxygenase [Frankia nepalensis]MBL7513743.1 TauD/TfdA family dioxygenase [Frankia nepalensis]MBL7523108.1 TauD/TfdA family dioxygenase [Frankia nepalensis]MBL7631657.1 TauD/TfdA family dioxygenase [Frankia nepalensis]
MTVATPTGATHRAGLSKIAAYVATIEDPACWDAASLQARRDSWELTLTDAQADQLRDAVRATSAASGDWRTNRSPGAWLPATEGLAGFFGRCESSLEGGVGIARLRNLPVSRDDADILYNENLLWAIGSRLGHPVNQMGGGKVLARLRDLRDPRRGRDTKPEDTNDPLRHHTDGSDLLALMCVRQAVTGGNSFISSSARTVREIARREPELLVPLLEDFFAFDRNEEQPDGEDPFYLTRLCVIIGSSISTRYSREMIEGAQTAPGAPPLTARQRRLMDVFDEIAAEGGAEVDFTSGDLMVVNNYSVLHGRSRFHDADDPAQRRLLLRLWIAMHNARPLPFDWDRGVNTDGVGRGGVPLKNAGMN